MGAHFTDSVVTLMAGIAAVAIVALIVSKKSQTPQVIQSFFSGYGNDLGVAVSPVTGNQYRIDLSYPGGSGLGAGLGFTPNFAGMYG